IQTAAALQQANIVPVLSAGETHGLPFYMMPFVEGESLRARLARGPLPVGEVIGILRDVSKALAYAHRQGVVHRDIKPDNVLLSEGTAVVTDFGIAKAISASRTAHSDATLTQLGTSIGTPAYMAPEQAAGDADIDQRADIYSLGALAYELLAGQPVFAGRTPQRMLAAHMSEMPRAITELRVDVPQQLADLVMRCLAKDPDDRPTTATDITRALESITSGSGMQAMPAVLLGGPGMFGKALAIYAAAFVAAAILAKGAIVGIGLPEWVFPGTLLIMGLGLPVVLWTGYVQRVTRRAFAATPTYTPGGTPTAGGQGTMATMALRAAPHVSWYRTARGGVYAMGTFIVLIALFMGMRAFGIGPFGSLLASGRMNARDPILIADFRTSNTDSTLGRVVSDAVRAGLAGSSAFTLVSPNAVVGALELMRKPPTTRVDSAVARQIALREGIKVIVDGEVTGVTGGYIVSVSLVRADSGIELASFRETGDGPRGLIDAADKLARALRSRAGESLREVNATPPLRQATTASLDALRKYSEGVRLNALGDPRAVAVAREAVARDSTFATAWSLLGAALSNQRAPRSAIDSALSQAFRFRERVSPSERDYIVARYYALGPGRDRARAIAAYESMLARGDSGRGALVNLGEMLRTRREFARAESLNVASLRTAPGSAVPLGNMVELQIDQGKFEEAAETATRLREVSRSYGTSRQAFIFAVRGDRTSLQALLDTIMAQGGDTDLVLIFDRNHAIAEGRLRTFRKLSARLRKMESADSPTGSAETIEDVLAEIMVAGPGTATVARLDSATVHATAPALAEVDREYVFAAAALAYTGDSEGARAMLARYRAEVSDTSLRRSRESDVHQVLGEIALAEDRPTEALVEFRRADVGSDGAPAHECAPCTSFDLARAFEAAGQRDSAIVMYERYLATPFAFKFSTGLDPVLVPTIRERLAMLYEAAGNSRKAAENYAAFIDLWKNADQELRPRVDAAREGLKRVSPDSPQRHVVPR
ncbi:MAG TPA: protein kinase, partial [Gemmatimonadaceae bacterium]|nr:protein kinase [Gemmatimonadaceae bacterium]